MFDRIPRFWRLIWWLPYNNTHEKTSEALYQYGGARDWVYRDASKRFQLNEKREPVNHPTDVLPEYR